MPASQLRPHRRLKFRKLTIADPRRPLPPDPPLSLTQLAAYPEESGYLSELDDDEPPPEKPKIIEVEVQANRGGAALLRWLADSLDPPEVEKTPPRISRRRRTLKSSASWSA